MPEAEAETMAETLFTNVRIFPTANAKRPYAGEVMLQGNLIKKVAEGQKQDPRQRGDRGWTAPARR